MGIDDSYSPDALRCQRADYLIDAELCGAAGPGLCGVRSLERSEGLQLPGITDVYSCPVLTCTWDDKTAYRADFWACGGSHLLSDG
ncbi:hypothetical protein D3C74_382480 [compost metagenome]